MVVFNNAMKWALVMWLLCSSCLAVNPPNDCAIVATEAYYRLKKVSYWIEMVWYQGEHTNGEKYGHVVVLWQVRKNGRVNLFDATGAYYFLTNSTNLADLLKEIERVKESKITSYIVE